jgi:hypothetical protein
MKSFFFAGHYLQYHLVDPFIYWYHYFKSKLSMVKWSYALINIKWSLPLINQKEANNVNFCNFENNQTTKGVIAYDCKLGNKMIKFDRILDE